MTKTPTPTPEPMKFWIVYQESDIHHCGNYVVGPVTLEQDKFGIPYFITEAGTLYWEILKRFDTEYEAQMWNRAPWWKQMLWGWFRRRLKNVAMMIALFVGMVSAYTSSSECDQYRKSCKLQYQILGVERPDGKSDLTKAESRRYEWRGKKADTLVCVYSFDEKDYWDAYFVVQMEAIGVHQLNDAAATKLRVKHRVIKDVDCRYGVQK